MKKLRRIALVKYSFLLALLSGQAVQAQNKVVVVPLSGTQLPSIPHPIDSPFTNSLGMQFNTLPAGSFTMGSPTNEPGGSFGEGEHRVTLSKVFGMQVTEVTNEQWNSVIVDSSVEGSNPSESHDPANELDSHPVDSVTWFDAVFFANQLSSNESRSKCYTFSGQSGTPGANLSIMSVTQNTNCTGYRLPTEAEWEYAARAGTSTAYANPIGFDSADTETRDGFNANLHAMGWYSYNREMQNASGVTAYEDGTKPVAHKQANAWGLFDMHGNVDEWCWDFFKFYSGNAETDPSGPDTGGARILRGGNWDKHASRARSAFRNTSQPDDRNNIFGFRLVLNQIQ